MKTFSAKSSELDKKWLLIDADGLVLGRGLIGEAAVDLCGRRIGERLANALDKIVPHRREDAPQTRGDARKTWHQHGRNAEFAGDL